MNENDFLIYKNLKDKITNLLSNMYKYRDEIYNEFEFGKQLLNSKSHKLDNDLLYHEIYDDGLGIRLHKFKDDGYIGIGDLKLSYPFVLETATPHIPFSYCVDENKWKSFIKEWVVNEDKNYKSKRENK